jgi:hypothetical protein
VANLLLLSEALPLLLALIRLLPPSLADDFRDLWIGEPWVLGYDLGLVMLPVQDEG